jgi:hypothetical protein
LERFIALRVKRLERKANHSLPSSAEASKSGAIRLLSHVTLRCARVILWCAHVSLWCAHVSLWCAHVSLWWAHVTLWCAHVILWCDCVIYVVHV